MIELSKYRGMFAKLYADRFDVYRNGTETDANGATHNVRKAMPALQNVACLASPESADDAMPRPQALLNAEQYISIHCSPEIDLFNGDYLVIRKYRNGAVVRVYRGTIGEPKIYPTHIKATLKIDKSEAPNG